MRANILAIKVKCVLNDIKISVLKIRSFWGARLVGAELTGLPKQNPRVRAVRDFPMLLVIVSQSFWAP